MKAEFKKHNEAIYNGIIQPQLPKRNLTFDKWISYRSDEWQRLAVVQLTRYLCLETRYRHDLGLDVKSWKDNSVEVLGITTDVIDKKGDNVEALIGMFSFRTFGHHNPVLYHCYLHPSFRRRNLMIKAWEEIKAKYPTFEIEPPCTPSMTRFLSKVNTEHVLKST